MECKKCTNMAETCTIESLYALGQLKACPYQDEPVLDSQGWVLNPKFIERYQLSVAHIFLIPEKVDRLWVIHWSICRDGSGSCGNSGPDLFILSYKKAIESLINNRRFSPEEKQEIKYISENKFDSRRTFQNNEIQEEIPIKEKYVSPFEATEYGKIGEQLELF